MSKQSAKYRPYLTIQQLHYFLSLCEADNRTETETIRARTIRELKLFIAKNDLGAVSPQYTTSPRQSVEEKLGLALDSSDPVTRRKAAYDLWNTNPTLCTQSEIIAATLYRYENNLMTPEEELAYEASL